MNKIRRIFRKSTRSSSTQKNQPGLVKKSTGKARLIRSMIEALEDRTMLSASSTQLDTVLASRAGVPGGTTATAMVDSALSIPVPLSSFAAFVQGQPAPSQVVMVDGAVPDYDALIASIGGSGPA